MNVRLRTRQLLAGLGLLLAGHRGVAQDEVTPPVMVRLDVTVTAVAASNAYLDKGRLDHIEPGDPVVLRPVGAPEVPGIVRLVTRNSCRVELPPGTTSIAIGDRGEVQVPKARLEAPPEPKDGTAPAEHAPWTAKDDGYAPSQPLLAPALGQAPEDRPTQVWGRLWASFDGNWDKQNGSDFQLWRTGAEVTIENPFGDGGEAHIEGDLLRHISNFGLGDGQTDNQAWLDRASYSWGGTRQHPDRFEVGRFLQENFPQLGVLDGVEASHRLESGGRIGGSFGFMPEPFPSMKTGNDLQAAVFYRSDADGLSPLAWGVAYQNTWHNGAQDRNLVVGDFDAALGKDVSVSGEALVDYYGPGGDTLKSGGFQLTEGHVNGRWQVEPHTGLGLHASQMAWPEIKRNEFGELPSELVSNGEVTRYGVDGWHDFGQNLRLDGRVDAWQDQSDSGGSGDVRATLRDVLWPHGSVALDLFTTSGSTTDGGGLRLSASHQFDSLGYGTLSWESSTWSGNSLQGPSTNTSQQTWRASLDRAFGPNWNASIYTEKRTGDNLDSYSLGLYLQERF